MSALRSCIEPTPRRQPAVGHLRLFEELRDDAGDLASGVEHGVGDRAHEPDVAATAHEADAPAGQRVTEPPPCPRTRRLPGVGPAEHAQSQHGGSLAQREPRARPQHRSPRTGQRPSDRWSRGGYRSATSAPMTPGPGGGRGRHRSRAARRRAGVRQLAEAGGPEVHQSLAYDLAHAAAEVEMARAMLEYGEGRRRGPPHVRLRRRGAARPREPSHRARGRGGWRTTPRWPGYATSPPATGVRTSRPNWPRWRALATSIRTSSWCRTVSGPSPTRRSRQSPNTSTAPTVTFPRASSPA